MDKGQTQVMPAQQPVVHASAEKAADRTFTMDEVEALLAKHSATLEAKFQEQTKMAVETAVAGLASMNNMRLPPGQRPERRATTHKEKDDIKVRVIKDLNRSRMGLRIYDAPAGSEMWMNPAHACELTTGVFEKDPSIVIYK